jgi:phenylacetate-CoA ligase
MADRHYDSLETRDPAEREQALMGALSAQIGVARQAPAYAQALRDVDVQAIRSRAALATLPITRKSSLL